MEKDSAGNTALHLIMESVLGNIDVVEKFLMVHPKAAEEKNTQGITPFHIAVGSKATFLTSDGRIPVGAKVMLNPATINVGDSAKGPMKTGDIGILLEDDKSSVSYKVEFGGKQWWYDARALCMKSPHLASPEVVMKILDTCPQAAAEKDESGRLPLHMALDCEQVVPCVILRLLDVNPSAAANKDNKGNYPLHRALTRRNLDVEILTKVLDAYPQAAKEKNKDLKLPVHLAIGNAYIDKAVVDVIMHTSRDVLSEKDKDGNTILHLALNNPVINNTVIDKLLELFPDATRMKDIYGNYPLHVAAGNISANVTTITKLLDTCPRAASEKDNNGNTPLHIAVGNTGASSAASWGRIPVGSDVVLAPDFANYSDAAKGPLKFNDVGVVTEDKGSRYHVSFSGKKWMYDSRAVCARTPPCASVDVILKLLESYPPAASEKDKANRYPLTAALGHAAVSTKVILPLLNIYPDATLEANAYDGKYPLHTVCSSHCLTYTMRYRVTHVQGENLVINS
jgi:ankyrin repeat protein